MHRLRHSTARELAGVCLTHDKQQPPRTTLQTLPEEEEEVSEREKMETITLDELCDFDVVPADGWYIAGETMEVYSSGRRVELGEKVYCWNGWVCDDEEDARKLSMMLDLGTI